MRALAALVLPIPLLSYNSTYTTAYWLLHTYTQYEIQHTHVLRSAREAWCDGMRLYDMRAQWVMGSMV